MPPRKPAAPTPATDYRHAQTRLNTLPPAHLSCRSGRWAGGEGQMLKDHQCPPN